MPSLTKEAGRLRSRFEQGCSETPHATAISAHEGSWSYAELLEEAALVEAELRPLAGRVVGLAHDSLARRLIALLALDRLHCAACFFPRPTRQELVERASGQLELAATMSQATGGTVRYARRDRPSDESAESTSGGESQRDGEIILFTSGTSGPPKPVWHRWASLISAVREGQRYRRRRWLLSYDWSSFAGMQVWLQALLTGGTVCLPASREPAGVAEALARWQPEFASGTPTFWRMLLSSAPAASLRSGNLRQITLGGEAVDQGILDTLAGTFPQARISHIYASTEMGVCFSVHDGRAGFPADYLDSPVLGCRLRIADDGELMISSPRAMRGYAEGSADPGGEPGDGFASGDLVERRGDRVLFVGRKSSTINVGGNKVYPEMVEQTIRHIAGVREARVSALRSSLVGELVKAQIVPEGDVIDTADLEKRILAECRRELPKYQVPAVIEFRDKLATNLSGKLVRGEEQQDG